MAGLDAPIKWTVALAREVALAPRTLRHARQTITDLARLPDQLDRVADTLERTAAGLEHSVAELSMSIGGGMNDRLEHLDTVVSDLRDTLTGLIGAIPGVRRTLQSVVRPSRD